MIREHLRLLRIKHWIKNIFVFPPLVFSLTFHKPDHVLRSLAVFGIFCLTASAVYILNDIFDRKRDRLHPKKKNRPLAAGTVTLAAACIMAGLLITGAVLAALKMSTLVLIVILIYLGMNLIYSSFLRNQTFIDVMIIAVGFLLRIIAGAVAIQVALSQWMLLTTFFLSLFLGFGKRRKEAIQTNQSVDHREVFQDYSVELLNGLILISAALTIITYSLYVVNTDLGKTMEQNWFFITIPFVVFGVFRYMLLLFGKNEGDDPSDILLKDRVMIVDILLWLITVFILLQFAPTYGKGL